MADKNTNSSPVTSISFTPKSPTNTSGLPVANVNPMSGTIMPAVNNKIVTNVKPSKPFKAPAGVGWRELLNAPVKFVQKISKEVVDELNPWITPPIAKLPETNRTDVLPTNVTPDNNTTGGGTSYKGPMDTRSTTPYTPYVNNTGYVPNPESPYAKYLNEPNYTKNKKEEPIEYTGMSDEEKRTFDWKKAYGLEDLPKNIDTYDKYLNALKRKNGLVVTDKETGNSTEFTMGGQPIKNQDSSYLRGLRQQVKEGKISQAVYDVVAKGVEPELSLPFRPTDAQVTITDRDGNTIGQINWDMETGEIAMISSNVKGEKYSHELIRKAREFAKENNIPAPQHSANRTLAGEAFARQDAKITQEPYVAFRNRKVYNSPEPRSPRVLAPVKGTPLYDEYLKLINNPNTTKEEYIDLFARYDKEQEQVAAEKYNLLMKRMSGEK